MPKIRQAIAVLIAAASCIGFNTYRYPAVWEMVAAVPQPSRPAGKGANATAAAAKEPDRNASGEPGANLHDDVVCKDGVCTMPHADTPLASVPGSTPNSDQAESKPATDLSSEPEAKSKDPDSPFRSQDSEVGPAAKGPQPEDAAITSESDSKPREPEPGSMSKGLGSEFMSKGSESEYPAKAPEWDSKPREAESADKPTQSETPSNAGESGSAPEGQDFRTGPAKTESYPYPSGPSNPEKAARKPAAHLVSESAAVKSPAEKTATHPVAAQTLFPIERPRPRGEDAMATATRPGARGLASPSPDSFGSKSATEGESDSQGIRHLPPADADSGSDAAGSPPTITPELMRTYRVTPAK